MNEFMIVLVVKCWQHRNSELHTVLIFFGRHIGNWTQAFITYVLVFLCVWISVGDCARPVKCHWNDCQLCRFALESSCTEFHLIGSFLLGLRADWMIVSCRVRSTRAFPFQKRWTCVLTWRRKRRSGGNQDVRRENAQVKNMTRRYIDCSRSLDISFAINMLGVSTKFEVYWGATGGIVCCWSHPLGPG